MEAAGLHRDICARGGLGSSSAARSARCLCAPFPRPCPGACSRRSGQGLSPGDRERRRTQGRGQAFARGSQADVCLCSILRRGKGLFGLSPGPSSTVLNLKLLCYKYIMHVDNFSGTTTTRERKATDKPRTRIVPPEAPRRQPPSRLGRMFLEYPSGVARAVHPIRHRLLPARTNRA